MGKESLWWNAVTPNLFCMDTKKVLILVEGQTELGFVKRVLSVYVGKDIELIPTIHTTKNVKSGPNFKGGATTYSRIEKEVLNLLADSSACTVTTMFDYYGLPHDFPGFSSKTGNCYEQIAQLEKAFADKIGNNKFVPYIQLHEFEALLFSAPEVIDVIMSGKQLTNSNLRKIRAAYNSPEEINDNPTTAPSKRIEKEYGDYQKPLHGQTISEEIGIATILKECKHFSEWIQKIKSVVSS